MGKSRPAKPPARRKPNAAPCGGDAAVDGAAKSKPRVSAKPPKGKARSRKAGGAIKPLAAEAEPGPLQQLVDLPRTEAFAAPVEESPLPDSALERFEPPCVVLSDDPFGMNDPEPEALPFDAPDENDLPDLPNAVETPPLQPEAVERLAPSEPLRPPEPELAPAAPPAATPGRYDYLAKARRAAQAQSLPKKQSRFGAMMREPKRIALSVTAALAAPLLLGGAWTLNANGAPSAEPQAIASAPAPAPVAREGSVESDEHAAQYESALQLIGAGNVDGGVARLRRAAEGGFPIAQYRLAKLYERGEIVPRNIPLARQWSERAARAGNCRAMHDVGVYFARGEGVPQDEVAAFRWFHEAAECGVADSQYNLGVLYQRGRGVTANAQEALFWYLVAAHHQDVDAVDRAVELAAQLSPMDVAQARARARAFQARPANAVANAAPVAQPAGT